jgi:hypothetical protein
VFIWQLEPTSPTDRTHTLTEPLAEWAKTWNRDVIAKFVQPAVDTTKPYNKLVAVVADSVEEAIALALQDDKEWRWFNSNERFGDCLRNNEPLRVEVPGSERSRVVVLSGSDSAYSKKGSSNGGGFGSFGYRSLF